jgi:hypothetical protein
MSSKGGWQPPPAFTAEASTKISSQRPIERSSSPKPPVGSLSPKPGSSPKLNPTLSPKLTPKKKKAGWAPDVFVPGEEETAPPKPTLTSGKSVESESQDLFRRDIANNLSPTRGITKEGNDTFRSRPISAVPRPLVDPRLPTIPLSAQAANSSPKLRGRSPPPPASNYNPGTAAGMVPSTRGLNPPVRELISPKSALKSSRELSPKGGRGGGGVNWNKTLFVVDKEEFTQIQPEKSTRNPRRGGISRSTALSRKDTLIVDQAVLQTRLEWNQLLVSKTFKPYRQMICEFDDDMPDPEDLDTIDDDEFEFQDEEWPKVRNEMLNDPELTEREIAAFFEGFKLFQLKVNSLQAQLAGMKAMQRLPTRSVMMSMRGDPMASVNTTSERNLGRGRAGVPFPGSVRERRSVGSLPEATGMDRKALMNLARSSSSTGESQKEEKEVKPTETKPEEDKAEPEARPAEETPEAAKPAETASTEAPKPVLVPVAKPVEKPAEEKGPPPRMMNRSLRALSIKRIRGATEGEGGNKDISRLLEELEEAERRQRKLEKQLAAAGVQIAEDIPYEIAKKKVLEIAIRMNDIGGSDVTDPDPEKQKSLREEYFKLEQDMEKYTAALTLTDEWIEEQEELERQWEASVEGPNEKALKQLRRHMPVEVRNMSEAALASQSTPNGKYLPKDIAKKFKRTNVLQLLRIDPEDIVPLHPSSLENMRVTGLTLTERRALYAHLKDIGPRWKAMQAEKMTERKWTWYNMMKGNFKENADSWQRHVDKYGSPGNHPYTTRDNPDGGGCPLIGKQCPLKADKLIDYDGDYGFPDTAEYFKSEVKKSDVDNLDKAKQEALEALRGRKANERGEALKKHYKGKILQVSLANGSAEAMDEAVDKMESSLERWIKDALTTKGDPSDDEKKKIVASINEAVNELKLSVLQFADRSGMQLTGKRDANADQPDIRSMIEMTLCEEVIETAEDFFKSIEERMEEIKVKDGRMKSSITQLRQLMDELRERNTTSIEALVEKGEDKLVRSRKLKTKKIITEEVKKTLVEVTPKEDTAPVGGPPAGMPGGGAGRGNLLGAIAGRGRGGGGRGGLLGAIAGRGRGGGGGGRGGLLGAIAGRGRGGGGRGDLLGAIAGRGGGDAGGGGRGDFLSAIAGRGVAGRDGDAGRGGMMAAIQARSAGDE